MTEPTLISQLLGVATIFICLFVAMLIVANNEHKAKKQFNNIARENIRNCDRQFTFDTQAPVGLRPDLLALPQPKEY